MACIIILNPPSGISVGGRLTAIRISGTATECARVSVRIEMICAGMRRSATQSATVSFIVGASEGHWSTDFVPPPGTVQCNCGDHIDVTVTCAEGGSCSATPFSGTLNCPEEPRPVCPEITLVLPTRFEDCVDGSHPRVSLTVTFTLPAGGSVEGRLFYRGRDIGHDSGPSPLTVMSDLIALPPGPATVRAEVVDPPGCPATIVIFTVPPCETPSTDCPTIGEISPLADPDPCIDGRRVVHFSAPIDPGGRSVGYHWQYADDERSDSHEVHAPETVRGSHSYPPGTYTVTLVPEVEGCPPRVSKPFEVRPCPPPTPPPVCPGFVSEGSAEGCAPAGGTTTVHLSATLTLHPGVVDRNIRATILDESGHELAGGSGDGDSPLDLSTTTTAPAGRHTYPVRIDHPVGCSPDGIRVTVHACGGNGNGGGNGSSSCGSMVFIVGFFLAAAMATTVFTVVWATCFATGIPIFPCCRTPVPWWLWLVVIAAWLVAAIALGVWYLLCTLIKDCKCPTACDFLQLGVMTSLAGAAVAAYLIPCCPSVPWIAGVLGGLFVGALVTWVLSCRPSLCRILATLSLAFVSCVLVALGYLSLSPLGGCGSELVRAIEATLGGLVSIGTAACALREA